MSRKPNPNIPSPPEVVQDFRGRALRAGYTPDEIRAFEPCVVQTRLSVDRHGTSMSIKGQVNAILDEAVRRRLLPVACLIEVVSGSDVAHGRRAAMDRFLQSCEEGRAPAKIVLCDSIDRFTRHPADGERWIRLMEEQGFDIVSVHDDLEGELKDRVLWLRMRWAMAKSEIDVRRARRARTLALKAEAGEPLTGLNDNYGHIPVRRPRRGPGGLVQRTVGARAVPAEAARIVEFVRRLREGEGPYQILRDWEAQGVRARSGREIKLSSWTRLMLSPRMCGGVWLKTGIEARGATRIVFGAGELDASLIDAHGEVIARARGPLDPAMRPIEPILAFEDWRWAVERLQRSPRSWTPARYLLSGILAVEGTAGRCTGHAGSNGKPAYYMHLRPTSRTDPTEARGRGAAIQCHIADGAVQAAILLALDHAARKARPAEAEPPVDRTAAERLAEIDEAIERLQRDYYRPGTLMSAAVYESLLADLRSQRDDREAALDAGATPVRVGGGDIGWLRARIECPEDVDGWREAAAFVVQRVWLAASPRRGVGCSQEHRLRIEWCEGFAVPDEALRALWDRLEAERKRANGPAPRVHNRTSPETEDVIMRLHASGAKPSAIAQTLARAGVLTAGGIEWSGPGVRRVLRRLRGERMEQLAA